MVLMALPGWAPLLTPALRNQNGAKVVDVGEGWSAYDQVAQRLEKTVAIIIVQHGARAQTDAVRACQAVRRPHGAGVVLRAVDAIGIAGDGVHTGERIE